MKLKIATAVLALASLVLLLTGGTYLTATLAIICATMALPLAGHLTLRWFLDEQSGFLLWLYYIIWVMTSGPSAMRTLQKIGAIDTPLSDAIDPEKVVVLGYFVSLTSIIAIILAVIAPSSPKHDDNSDDDKG